MSADSKPAFYQTSDREPRESLAFSKRRRARLTIQALRAAIDDAWRIRSLEQARAGRRAYGSLAFFGSTIKAARAADRHRFSTEVSPDFGDVSVDWQHQKAD
jgi:hypothetical protein